jgi:glycosyltransferase involved in cell wall biosynthesis
MKVLYFGMYSKGPEYPRNNNIIRSLGDEGISVSEAHADIDESFRKRIRVASRLTSAVCFLLQLILSYAVLSWKFMKTPQVDAVIVGHPGYFHIHLARILCRMFRKHVIVVYDVFIPLYDALVEDRRLLSSSSRLSKVLHAFESSCCKAADLCLIDTDAHKQYLMNEFNISRERIHVLRVGPTITNSYISPPNSLSDPVFKVLFVGTYIPLHGIEVILKAARLFGGDSGIVFYLVGSGQLSDAMHELAEKLNLRNVVFKNWVPISELGDFIRSHDIGLGIFGTTPKTGRVIPSKIYDMCTAGIPFVTSDTPAVREVFTHRENAYLVPADDPSALGHTTLSRSAIGCELSAILMRRAHGLFPDRV